MNRITAISLVLLLASCASQPPADRSASLLAFEQARIAATKNSDVQALQSMLAEDVVWVHSNGKVDDKAAYLADFQAQTTSYTAAEAKASRVRFYGEIGIVTGDARFAGVSHGEPFDFQARYTAVYRWQGSTWQAISWQTTRIPPQP
ncbi:MAG: nuclear transport factor 2 family protein [Bacteroidia bacterium]|nr:nuclear transport factor 2 family protein [Bacteroidia bacterium]